MERLTSINSEGDGMDGRVLKPSSPSLHDSHSMYKYDKV